MTLAIVPRTNGSIQLGIGQQALEFGVLVFERFQPSASDTSIPPYSAFSL